MYLAETDHLGSLIGLTDTAGVYVEKYSYDPWGRRRNPSDWSFNNVPAPTIADRGFTGHEHLDIFRLINMNGRLYDPVTGRFLNADPVIDNTAGAQGLNSYTYCLNNPLKYIDPSGFTYRAIDGSLVPSWYDLLFVENGSFLWRSAQDQLFESGGGGGSTSNRRYTFTKKPYTVTELAWVMNVTMLDKNTGEVMFSRDKYEPRETTVWLMEVTENFPAGGGDSHVQSAGDVFSFSFDFAFAGGLGVEIGRVKDNSGNKKWFISGNVNIGYGLGAGLNYKEIVNTNGYSFNVNNYKGYTSGFSWAALIFGGEKTGDKPAWKYSGLFDWGHTYIQIGGSVSILSAPRIGGWWTNASTLIWP